MCFRPKSYTAKELCIGKTRLKAYVADTWLKRAYGLMYWKRLKPNECMLFVGLGGRPGIWMLNMKFSIDILWLDKHMRVVDLVERAKPCRLFRCKVYYPKKEASYVLELNAGSARKMAIRIGDRIGMCEH
ncbi:MAG: DUF192 domain-containing protein [Candidatus Micrarchaeia archaeon]